MPDELICHTIAPASNPSGHRLMTIQFGIEQDVTRAAATTGTPVLYDNKVIVFLAEEDWKRMKDKFTVGDKFSYSFNSGKLELKKK